MSYDFDRMENRRGTNSYKWDQSKKLFGREDILPLWVADMDFQSPPAVVKALTARAQEGMYGYSFSDDAYRESIVNWYARRHDWTIEQDWLTDTPGIVPALSLAVELFSNPGDAVILQSPVYYPFYDVIRMNDRKIARNELILQDGRYVIDFSSLETLMIDGARLLLFCNPHNPGGRVWSHEELEQLAALCIQYDVIVVSDEIHCDLVYPGHRHLPFASLSPEISARTITTLAPTKTFNIPGLQTAFTVISNPEIKRKFDRRVKALSLHMASFFGPVAVQACYNHGEAWLDDLLIYLKQNVDETLAFFKTNLPEAKPMSPEGTYLLWIDCRGFGLSTAELKKVMFEDAGVAFSDGSIFGAEGEGFLRINIACPRSLLLRALEQFHTALRHYLSKKT